MILLCQQVYVVIYLTQCMSGQRLSPIAAEKPSSHSQIVHLCLPGDCHKSQNKISIWFQSYSTQRRHVRFPNRQQDFLDTAENKTWRSGCYYRVSRSG